MKNSYTFMTSLRHLMVSSLFAFRYNKDKRNYHVFWKQSITFVKIGKNKCKSKKQEFMKFSWNLSEKGGKYVAMKHIVSYSSYRYSLSFCDCIWYKFAIHFFIYLLYTVFYIVTYKLVKLSLPRNNKGITGMI